MSNIFQFYMLRSTEIYGSSLWFYQDAGQIQEYAKDSIAAATEAGIRLYQSDPPLLHPNQNLTRAEATVLIYQAMEQVQQQ